MRYLSILFWLLVVSEPAVAQAPGADPHALRVLLLFPGDLLQPAGLEQAEITKAALREAIPRDLVFFAEALDSLRLPSAPEQEHEFVALLRKRYSLSPPDLIVLHGPMQGFANRMRGELWDNVPLMFVGMAAHRLQEPDFPRDIPGTTARFDVTGTVDLALRLQPDAKRLLVVAGSSSYDRAQVTYVTPFLEQYRDRLKVEFLPEEPIEATLRRLAALPRNSIVLQLTVLHDGNGKIFVPVDLVQKLALASSAPSYTYYDHYLPGGGIVGGSMANWAAQKEMIGRIARELLSGGARKESLYMHPPVAPLCMVDWRQLERWHLSAARLPKNCLVRFREPGFWERYHREAIAIGIVVLVQSALIFALLVQRRRRHIAELEAHQQRRQLAHAARLATVGELSASIAHEINQPLAAILSNAEAGESMLDSGRPDLHELREILTAIRDEDIRASEVIQRIRRLLRREPTEALAFDINEAIDSIVRLTMGLATRHTVAITTRLERSIPRIKGDLVQMQQVILNLIVNAVDAVTSESTEKRYVSIATREHPPGHVEVSVSDGGPGIAPEKLPRLFEPFYSTKPEGMGLGLSISRSIVQAHRGRIWAESTASGSVFRFCIPV